MCGRFVLHTNAQQIAKIFAVKQSYVLETSYNIAPTQLIHIIVEEEGERKLKQMRWGYIPFWQKSASASHPLINARLETIEQKPAFKRSIKTRRCLIIADGFYEWSHTSRGVKQPYYFHLPQHKPFAMAGIWDQWQDDHTIIQSCCIITTNANPLIAAYHDRMPGIIQPEDYELWLDPTKQDWSLLKKFSA